MITDQSKTTNRFADVPRDKPVSERTEHANLDRPGAQAHPRAMARDWSVHSAGPKAWALH